MVVGCGGSGLATAVSAVERGARVLVLEKSARPGGTTALAVGSFTACRTSLQRAAGIDDSPEAHAEDAALFAPREIEARNNERLRRFFLARAGETFEWLRRLGVEFRGPFPEPPNRVPRMHAPIGGAAAYTTRLLEALERRGGVVVCEAAVAELARDDARVTGVRYEQAGELGEAAARRGVVLAAGDYSAGGDLIAAHKGERFRPIGGVNPATTGDGQRLAAEAGGRLLNMDVAYGPELRFIPPSAGPAATASGLPAGVPLASWQHPENALLDDGAILINHRGDRFTDELEPLRRELEVASQPRGEAFLLLDARLGARYSAWPHFISTAPLTGYAYVEDYLRERPDIAVRAEDLGGLAERRAFDRERLRSAVVAFRRHARGGVEDPFGRRRRGPEPGPGPWTLLGPARACFTTTEGGAAVSERLEVLDADGRPIPGLYAVGQSGLGGMVLWGHGLHIAWAISSGRLAGEALTEL